MGQYRQWLHYREVDQQLRARLEQLEEQLAQLHEEANRLAQPASLMENVIIWALVRANQADKSTRPLTASSRDAVSSTAELEAVHSAETIEVNKPLAEKIPIPASSVLFAQSHLPNFDAQQMAIPELDAAAVPPSPHSVLALLPEDMIAFFRGLAGNSSPAEPSEQSHDAVAALAHAHASSPIDQQSLRTNRLVQRWLERWGRSSQSQQAPREEYES